MSVKEEIERRIESESPGMVRITNNDLDCKDCKFKRDDSYIFGNVSKCDVFPVMKPREVLKGSKCKYYDKGEENEY